MELFSLPGCPVRRRHDSVEYDSVHDIFGYGDGEALPHGPQRYLVDHRGIKTLDLLYWPGQFIDLSARPDVLEVPLFSDYFHRWQPVFDDQITGLLPVRDPALMREAAGI